MHADRFGGHCAELTERDQDTPLRHPDLVAVGINPGEGVRYETGADIQAIRQELFQFERHLVGRIVWHSLGRVVGHSVLQSRAGDRCLRAYRKSWTNSSQLAMILN